MPKYWGVSIFIACASISIHSPDIPQGEDPWNVLSICRNASGMWTYSFQMHWNAADISKNGGKSMQIPFWIFLYVDTDLRIPEAFSYLFEQDVENASRC